MTKVLYLLKKASIDPLLAQHAQSQQTSVILLRDSVSLNAVPADEVYVLDEDLKTRGLTSTYRTISYGDMLNLMFEADHVIAL